MCNVIGNGGEGLSYVYWIGHYVFSRTVFGCVGCVMDHCIISPISVIVGKDRFRHPEVWRPWCGSSLSKSDMQRAHRSDEFLLSISSDGFVIATVSCQSGSHVSICNIIGNGGEVFVIFLLDRALCI